MTQRSSSSGADAFTEALQLQLDGHTADAERRYRALLIDDPRHAGAQHCLGMILLQRRATQDALPRLLAALQEEPANADYWLGYLEALLIDDSIDQARETFELARRHGLQGRAADDFAARLASRSSDAPNPPALIAPAAPTRAERRRAQRDAPRMEAELLSLLEQGRFGEARDLATEATRRFPDRGLGFKVQGALLWADRRSEQAVSAMRTAARLLPDDAEVHGNLGATYASLERYDEAEASLRKALAIDPILSSAHVHLGNVFQQQGRYSEAEDSLRRALATGRTDSQAGTDLRHSSWLFLLSHNATVEPEKLFAEHCRIGSLLEEPHRAASTVHRNDLEPRRRLKIGFISGDLCNHAVAHFIEPIIAELAPRPTLELHAYSNNPAEDEVTRRLRAHFAHWNPITPLSDRELAARILDDRIDVLIELSGHTSLNRLAALARKPAPLQISWIGYPGTTGMQSIDYYFADRHFLPSDRFAQQFVEKLVYLPANVPFRAPESAPPIGNLPALRRGVLTFGSFNRLGKITPLTIETWAALLTALPEARLWVGGIPAPGAERDLSRRLTSAGIPCERVRFALRSAMDSYLAQHHEVDVCLDTVPYGGGTTTINALWMGVPTLTLAGATPASRQGAAILGQLGLDDFVAQDRNDFVFKGCSWARRIDELAELRADLRNRWLRSPARSPAYLAQCVERALRHMWMRRCAGLPAESFEAAALADEEDARA